MPNFFDTAKKSANRFGNIHVMLRALNSLDLIDFILKGKNIYEINDTSRDLPSSILIILT